jgi:hypothetical protein
MARQKSFKEMATEVTQSVYDCLCEDSRKTSPKKEVNLTAVRLSFESWIEKVSNIPIKELSDKQPGEWITIDGVNYLAGNLLIVKEFHKRGAADPLLKAHDSRKTDHVPIERLWTPTLFHKLDYKEARQQQIILGAGLRMFVGDAGPQHWILQDDVEDENWKAQRAARDTKIILRKRRKSLFFKHSDCKTTDQLMKKLGAWGG